MLTKQEIDLFNHRLGKAIKLARVNAKVKQEDLSKYLGFKSRISIANIENGRQNVQVHLITEIAYFLKVPIIDLIPTVDTVREEINPKYIKSIVKEFPNDIESTERIKKFISFSTQKK